MEATVELVKPRARNLKDFATLCRAYFTDAFEIDPGAREKFLKDDAVRRAFGGRLEHDRPGAVAEEDAASAVGVIGDAAERFGADDQDVSVAAGLDERDGGVQRVRSRAMFHRRATL